MVEEDYKVNVLIVDDDDKNIFLIEEELSDMAQYVIHTATNGMAALDIINGSNDIDIILLDVMMPTMSGFEVCKEIRKTKDRNQLPIIFVTALNHQKKILEGFKCGGNDYIVKPIIQEELIVRLGAFANMIILRKKHEEMQRDFTSMLVHDLRGPLTGIIGSLELIIRQTETFKSSLNENNQNTTSKLLKYLEDVDELTSISYDSSNKLLELVEHLLDLAKLESGTLSPVIVEANISDVIKSCSRLLLLTAQEKNIDIQFDLKDIIWNVDIDLLILLVQNLLGNAIKFTAINGQIFVSVNEEDEQLVVKVSDTGEGISKEELPYIFEKYKQTKTGKSFGLGTGLGMAIAKNVVLSHNGEIDVQSKVGKGTTFTAYFPKCPTSVQHH